jgi:hypothetical protein
MTSPKKRCAGPKPDGTKCEAAPNAGSEFCYFHDPSMAADRRQAQSLGGQRNRMKTLDPAVPARKIQSQADIVDHLYETIYNVERGLLDPKVANCVGFLVGQLGKALENHDLEERIKKLERAVDRKDEIADPLLMRDPGGDGHENE